MKRKLIGLASLCSVLLLSCAKDPLNNMTQEESRIYITNYDTAARFSNYRTFTISDSVAVVQNNQLAGREMTAVDVQFVNAVVEALQQRGYTRVARNQSPDLGVAISRIANTSTSIINYNDFGGYYGGWWDPWYWGAPGYGYGFPSYYGIYQSTERALMIDVFDLKNSAQNNQIRSVWSGMIRGSGIFNQGNAASQVASLFDQSTYFRRN
jgi:hypothetical protein